MAYKFPFNAKKDKDGRTELADAFFGDETGAPSNQNAIDLIPGWSSAFPAEFNVRAGELPLFEDPRIAWAMERFGDLKGRRVLELGPLEAAHTCALSQAGALVDAVEGSSRAYLKCLITKEIIGFEHARFFLGDFVLWLEENEKTYDFIVACGVLYHMREPLRLLQAIARRTNSVYIWTVAVNDDRKPTELIDFMGLRLRLYQVPYGERSNKYCGGLAGTANWMHRDDLFNVLKLLGFTHMNTTHEELVASHADLAALSLFAAR